MEKNNLHQPIEFWSEKIKLLDDRVRLLTNTFGFGKIGLELIIKHGKIIDVVFTEKITIRQTKRKTMKKMKKMSVSKYGFPKKVKIVNQRPGRPKKKRELVKQHVYEEFCEWSAKPTPLKEEKTMKEFGVKWDVSANTLTTWKHRQDFWEKVSEWRINWARDKTSDVINGLFKRAASRGEASEVKLWMQLVEDWSEKSTHVTESVTVIGIRGISDKDLNKLTKPPEKNTIMNGETPVEEAKIVKG